MDGYRARLLELGYSPLSVTRSLTVLGHLGRWMAREGVAVDQLDVRVVKTFLADHVRDNGRSPTASVVPLLDYLRREALVAPEPAQPLTPLDRLIGADREWLLVERALAPATVRGCGEIEVDGKGHQHARSRFRVRSARPWSDTRRCAVAATAAGCSSPFTLQRGRSNRAG